MAISMIPVNNKSTVAVTLTPETGQSGSARRNGNVISGVLNINGIASGGWKKVATISTPPKSQLFFTCINTTASGVGVVSVETSGAINIYHTLGGTQSFNAVAFTYII